MRERSNVELAQMRERNKDIISEKIKALRRAEGITQDNLTDALYMPNQRIKRIELKAMDNIDVSDLCAIADAFNVDIDYLLGKQKHKLQTASDISEATGLTYNASEVLLSMGKLNQTEMKTLSALICSPSFSSFLFQMKRYCIYEGESQSMLMDSYSAISDKDILIANIQHTLTTLINEAKDNAHDEIALSETRTRAFALVASSIIKLNKNVTESEILESLSDCGLDAEKEVKAFQEYFDEYKQIMKGRK